MTKKIIHILSALMLLLLLTSCGPRKIGWGVVLWSPNDEIAPTGTVLPIYEASRIDETYTLIIEDQEVEIDQWRVDFFDKLENAQWYADKINPYNETFALVEIQGLPIREEVDVSSDRVYRLRNNQTIKIVNRETEEVQIGSLTGSWYRVLTEDGTSGFCYSSALLIYTPSEIDSILAERNKLDDPLLDNFLTSVWRPSYFKTMLTRNAIDLNSFQERYSLKIDKESQVISLSLEDSQITESYNKISRIGPRTYIFEGSSFEVFFSGNTDAVVTYSMDGSTLSRDFVEISQDISSIIQNEYLRRENLYNDLLNRSQLLQSSAYGNITLNENNVFQWDDYGLLSSQDIIIKGSGDTGRVSFKYFLSTRLKQLYTGVITFTFSRNDQEVNFLYAYSGSGIQLIYLPPQSIENMSVDEEPRNPIVMFFAF